jgi:hypothetical protein
VVQRDLQQQEGDGVVPQDDAGLRGHRLGLQQDPEEVGDDVEDEGLGDLAGKGRER